MSLSPTNNGRMFVYQTFHPLQELRRNRLSANTLDKLCGEFSWLNSDHALLLLKQDQRSACRVYGFPEDLEIRLMWLWKEDRVILEVWWGEEGSKRNVGVWQNSKTPCQDLLPSLLSADPKKRLLRSTAPQHCAWDKRQDEGQDWEGLNTYPSPPPPLLQQEILTCTVVWVMTLKSQQHRKNNFNTSPREDVSRDKDTYDTGPHRSGLDEHWCHVLKGLCWGKSINVLDLLVSLHMTDELLLRIH